MYKENSNLRLQTAKRRGHVKAPTTARVRACEIPFAQRAVDAAIEEMLSAASNRRLLGRKGADEFSGAGCGIRGVESRGCPDSIDLMLEMIRSLYAL